MGTFSMNISYLKHFLLRSYISAVMSAILVTDQGRVKEAIFDWLGKVTIHLIKS